jgi:hypothetical protein
MAELSIVGETLQVGLSAAEKLEAVHGDVSVPLSSVRTVEVVENAMECIHGLRVGTGIPRSTAIGTFTSSKARIFGVIHHGRHRGVRITLEGADFDEIVVGCDDPEAVAAGIPVHP